MQQVFLGAEVLLPFVRRVEILLQLLSLRCSREGTLLILRISDQGLAVTVQHVSL